MGVVVLWTAPPIQATEVPQVTDDTHDTPSFVESALAQTMSVLMTTNLLSPRAKLKKQPPPPAPPPLVVKPPEPPPPDPDVPTDPPPVLTEVPEPGTMVTAALGGTLAFMAVLRKRRRRIEPESTATV
jgi:hypothetical protein